MTFLCHLTFNAWLHLVLVIITIVTVLALMYSEEYFNEGHVKMFFHGVGCLHLIWMDFQVLLIISMKYLKIFIVKGQEIFTSSDEN